MGGTLCKIGSPLLSFLLCSLCTPLQAKQEDNVKRKKKNTENKEIELKQRTRYAEELKQEAKKAYEICSRNRTNDKGLNLIKYKTSEQMTEIMNELTKVTEQQGRMNAMAEELRKDGRI